MTLAKNGTTFANTLTRWDAPVEKGPIRTNVFHLMCISVLLFCWVYSSVSFAVFIVVVSAKKKEMHRLMNLKKIIKTQIPRTIHHQSSHQYVRCKIHRSSNQHIHSSNQLIRSSNQLIRSNKQLIRSNKQLIRNNSQHIHRSNKHIH